MSIFGAMFSGVTGLSAQSQALGIIADNISNVNTVGYKGTAAQFSTLVTQSASQSSYTPGGVRSSPAQAVDRQGLLQSSTSKSDIAIAGAGFFLVNEAATPAAGSEFLFTRAGSFKPDKNGNLVNTAGYFLQGWPLANGSTLPANTSVLTSVQTINVSNLAGSATATTTADIALNLPSTAPKSGNGEINSAISTPLAGVANLDLNGFGTLDQVAKLTYNAGTQTITVTIGAQTGTFDVSAQAAQTYVSTGTLAGMKITLDSSFNFASAITTAANTQSVTSGTLVLGAAPVIGNFDANDLAALSTTALTFAVSAGGVVSLTAGPTGFSVDPTSQTVAATGARVITLTNGTQSFQITLDVTTNNGGAAATFNVNLLELQNSIGVGAPVVGATFSSAVQIFDSLGNAHDLVIQYTKVATNTWSVNVNNPVLATTGVTSGTVTPATRSIVFNGNGTPATITFPPVVITGWTTGANNSTVAVDLGTANQTNGVTQFAGQFALNSVDQNGARYGGFVGVSIGEDGTVTALFDNGEQLGIYKLPIVMFANPNGLDTRNGNAFAQNDRSGDIILQQANAGGAGVVAASALESSNVDLAEEFTKMITTQRAYSASAKVITTADDMLEELIRIRR